MSEFLCQSCGSYFPPEGFFGTNADGSPSSDYCKYCLIDGNFGKPDETIEEMIESCIPWRIKSEDNPNGFPDADTARAEMMRYFPKLKRWQ
ncbi:MAG: zinc ribbon domain-containing protein [Defluviitaleaceae bacterium]|nr:zinc ribbon domain-containing protein [Defluviitaleaceae bacterium]